MMLYTVLASGPLVAIAAYRLHATTPPHPNHPILTAYAAAVALAAICFWDQW
ncbi:hypothetical protein [Streptomyces sp. NPDC020489]|uniref:hypothetical protein n=1 Tax=Streptomyces sp. NPDC020489 TaxID=3365077 RepID=UPI0037BD8BB3